MGSNTSTCNSWPKKLPNVYIFNNIENNSEDVEILHQTFQLLECTVIEVKNQAYDDLKNIVEQIVSANFSQFNYIVLIILDNTNKEESIWITTDGKFFHINGDLITAISANYTLKGKLRFSIIQTNRIFSYKEPIYRKQKKLVLHPGKDVKYFATSTGCSLNHKWNNSLPSPFIRILCNEIKQNITSKRPIGDMLNNISKRVTEETGELPAKELSVQEPYILGRAI